MPLVRTEAPRPFDELRLGQIFRTSQTFDESAMDAFAALSGDHSAIHTSREVAKECGFPGRLQYGFLLASLLSRIVGENFDRAVCAAVSLDFTSPVSANAEVDVVAEVSQLQPPMRTVSMRITMTSKGKTVVRGKLTAVFLPKGRE